MSQVFVLGKQLPEKHRVIYALQKFYGVGPDISARICARFQIHSKMLVKELNQNQVVALQSFMGSPATSAPLAGFPRADPDFLASRVITTQPPPHPAGPSDVDTLRNIKLEVELRRQMLDNIAHHRNIGSYVGRRHVMALPVRGQNTRTNSVTARKLNRLERRF